MAHIGAVLGACLAAQSVPLHQYEKALKLLQGLHGLSSISARYHLGVRAPLARMWDTHSTGQAPCAMRLATVP